jgi:hypothetical protein
MAMKENATLPSLFNFSFGCLFSSGSKSVQCLILARAGKLGDRYRIHFGRQAKRKL